MPAYNLVLTPTRRTAHGRCRMLQEEYIFIAVKAYTLQPMVVGMAFICGSAKLTSLSREVKLFVASYPRPGIFSFVRIDFILKVPVGVNLL